MDIKAKLRYAALLSLIFIFSSGVSGLADTTTQVSSETGVYYTVKKGDTLWGLSQKFSDNPYTWPDLWSKNGQLTNPHLIYPGQKIKLVHRSDLDKLGTADKAMDAAIEDAEPVESAETAKETEPRTYYYSKIERAGFMRREPITPHGSVFKLKGTDQLMLGEGDTIYIKASEETPLVIGARYVTYRTLTPRQITARFLDVDRKKLNRVRKEIGTQHYLSGVVEITGERGGFFIGRITDSYRSIKLNDMIMPYKKRSRNIPILDGLESMEGEIITAEEGETTFGEDMVGFINRGTADGIAKGQVYTVFYYETKKPTDALSDKGLRVPVNIGKFIVLDAQEETATILVTDSIQGLSPGDHFAFLK
ncbi:LysM peptidoglycan-binding domain-containing protein [Desulfoluna butyratoxydans]|uniref:Lysm domain n=1 Tax=Desulfoluna butyratoxydans TaxID=231438 RepID=A0A4U8YKD1_9BACT|nr:LysM domain-containing protein [Desulfoluna butyratoxydans]VFQ44306.1 lysm domain [Desulfoluna butyratoxydans]